MTPEAKQKLKNLLVAHEELRNFPYTDTVGCLTIGVGRNLTDRGISNEEALALLNDDIDFFSDKLSHLFGFFDSLSDNRQIALVDICFNCGLNGFMGFKKMIEALKSGDYELASREVLKSRAAEQCPDRYGKLSEIIRTGEM
jgi:lysozyme